VVRLELRHGSAPPVVYDVASVSFLVGTVPGCDLRLPGAALPAVGCLLTRRPDGVELRKLAPIGALLVNGRPASTQRLDDGDRITLGAVELHVLVTNPARLVAVRLAPFPLADDGEAEQEERSRQLDAVEKELRERAEELETDRVIWYQRREQVEQECRRLREEAEALGREAQQRQQELEAREDGLRQAREEIGLLRADVVRQQNEIEAARRDIADVRRQLYDRYRQRRDRLAGLHEAIRRAARKVQERKGQVEAEARAVAARREEESVRKAHHDARAEELERERALLDEQQRLFAEREEQLQRQVAEKVAALEARERKLAADRQALEKSQAEYLAALARLDRAQAALEEREKRLRGHALEVDKRFEQLQRDTRELEGQATELDAWQAKLTVDSEQAAARKAEQDAAAVRLVQRSAALEGQQAMLAALRTRLERIREEVRREEEQLADIRTHQEEAEADLRRRGQEVQRLREELEAEQSTRSQEVRRLEERAALMESAVGQLRQAQEAVAVREVRLHEREQQLDALVAQQTEEGGLLRGRNDQVRELQDRLAAERQALRDREAALMQSEQGLAALQEQLRRRSEEIVVRQKAQEEEQRAHETALAAAEARRTEIEAERGRAEAALAVARQELDGRSADLGRLREELTRREEELAHNVERLKQTGRTVGGERKALAEERDRLEKEGQQAAEALAQARAAFETARQEVADLQRQLPELEARGGAAAERLIQAREQLRDHLGELHTYARDARTDLEALRSQVQAEAERVRGQEATLHRERDEHRLAVAAFRQQLIDWQAQVAEMKRSLAHGETRLERRLAEVDEQARQVDATSARLAMQAEQLEEQQRLVAERRGEVEQHLEDMREWYRRKLRELTGRSEAESEGGETVPAGSILTLTEETDPGDQKLGELLRSLGLVDADTLTALLVEARRQRRSLRQLLLAGGYLTLYQVALIEAGNLDGLVLGPFRLIDRVRATPREVVYRVFDPRLGQEAVLRHLSEAEMQDAVHPDEFRQRFAAIAAVRHPHLAATLEVLEIAERPAVLQEWLTGLPSSDWPALTAVPGVWYRLLCQVALGLHTLHQAGLAHGRLDAGSIILTAEGTVKLCGAGEPAWLSVPPTVEGDAAADLAALGRIATGWVEITEGRKGAKAKPLPESLQAVAQRLTAATPENRYPNAAVLLEDLEKAGGDVPANGAAWDRLLRHVRDEAVDTALRLSA
jgi:chromosome segregation ATPase